MRKCATCKATIATWAWQPFGPGDDIQHTFAVIGAHYRGFPVIKICDACKKEIQIPIDVIRGHQLVLHFTYKGTSYYVSNGQVGREPF